MTELASLFGVRIVESPHLPVGEILRLPDHTLLVGTRGPQTADDVFVLEERHAARMIVREGMADVLEWLGWDVELPLLADGKLPLSGQILGPDGLWRWPGYPEQHPCGHFTVRQGCGGCDPGAIEFEIPDVCPTCGLPAPCRYEGLSAALRRPQP